MSLIHQERRSRETLKRDPQERPSRETLKRDKCLRLPMIPHPLDVRLSYRFNLLYQHHHHIFYPHQKKTLFTTYMSDTHTDAEDRNKMERTLILTHTFRYDCPPYSLMLLLLLLLLRLLVMVVQSHNLVKASYPAQ